MVTTRYDANRRAGKVTLDAGLKLWREVTAYGENYKGYDVEVRVVFSDTEGRFTAQEVRVRQRAGGPPVTGEALRQVAVGSFVRRSLRANATLLPREPGERYEVALFGLLDPDDVDRMRAAGPTDETLDWVAKVYTLALATGDRPTKAVREVFDLSQATAGRWVARARDNGLLGPAEPGKAG